VFAGGRPFAERTEAIVSRIGDDSGTNGVHFHVFPAVPDGQTRFQNDYLPVPDPRRSPHLQAASPCIDAGTNLTGIVDDLDEIPRPLDGDTNGVATVDMELP